MPLPDGARLKTVMGPDWDFDDLIDFIKANSTYEVGSDNEGQVVIYTGLYTIREIGLGVIE